MLRKLSVVVTSVLKFFAYTSAAIVSWSMAVLTVKRSFKEMSTCIPTGKSLTNRQRKTWGLTEGSTERRLLGAVPKIFAAGIPSYLVQRAGAAELKDGQAACRLDANSSLRTKVVIWVDHVSEINETVTIKLIELQASAKNRHDTLVFQVGGVSNENGRTKKRIFISMQVKNRLRHR